MALKDNLKKYREMLGYKTAKDFAKMLGITYTTYILYENRGTWPNEENLIKIASALNVSLDQLLGRQFSSVDAGRTRATVAGFNVEKSGNTVSIVGADEKLKKSSLLRAVETNFKFPITLTEVQFASAVEKAELRLSTDNKSQFFDLLLANFYLARGGTDQQ